MSGLLDFIRRKDKFDDEVKEIFSRKYIDPPENGERYWLLKPFAMAVIDGEYKLIEPKLNPEEYISLETIHSKLKDKIIIKNEKDLKNKENILFREFIKEARKRKLNTQSIGKLWYYLRREFLGYGKIDPMFRDQYLEDISCSGYNLPVYVYHKGHGSLKTNVSFSEEELDNFVLKLAQKANVQVSLESPIADATLPTGERIQVTYRKVVSTRGSTFTIRKVSEEPITPLDLIAWDTVSPEIVALLWLCVESRLNILITGSTASGKTTMLNAISLFIPYNLKIVSIEDTREVRLPHENWTPLLAKDAEEMFELLKASLRQRPEYLIVGEIRGREAITMFQAMNTGHTTYSTLHAGDAKSAVNRLIHDPINVPVAMFDALDLLMVLRIEYFSGKIKRKLETLYRVRLSDNLKIETIPVYRWNKIENKYEELEVNAVIEKLLPIYGKPEEFILEELKRRAKFLMNLLEERPSTFEFVKAIEGYRNEFYKRL